MDYVSDQNPRPLYRIDALVGTPEYVNTAAIITPAQTEKLASVAFASRRDRTFPCFDKASTYLSYAYFCGAGGKDAEVAGRIKQAGQFFGIAEDLAKIDQALSTEKSAAESGPKYALPAGSVAGLSAQLYPINSREEVEASAHQLLHDIRRVPVAAFRKAATAMVKAAAEYPGTVLEARIVRAGTERFPDFGFAAKVASNRRFEVKAPEAIALYEDIVKAAATANEQDAEKFASLWAELDGRFGVRYENGIIDPWSAIFSGPTRQEVEKLASTFTFLADSPVPVSAVAAIPEEQLRHRLSAKSATALLATVKQGSAAALTALFATWEPEAQREVLQLALHT